MLKAQYEMLCRATSVRLLKSYLKIPVIIPGPIQWVWGGLINGGPMRQLGVRGQELGTYKRRGSVYRGGGGGGGGGREGGSL